MRDIVSTEDISGMDRLFEIYKTLPGNEASTVSEFNDFMSVNSSGRAVFLNTYCDYSFMRVERTTILKVKPKEAE
ncbi:hypothetical protein JGH11_04640 [Dysgonomonas sp. Marseille-P4677]|uniref:hypothetical protein n=1 Tax=Dysgonomonas sp. Marseille-P4677 TaxID=2364790 RepID=UPI001912D4F8|nr:hypothetical protein [Dysgonomonas sp. Marseille-P4677]MBK5720155.1 hypothetical protein [Dysgonomonas sp. Marseille-P4677]